MRFLSQEISNILVLKLFDFAELFVSLTYLWQFHVQTDMRHS